MLRMGGGMKMQWYYPRAVGVCGFARVGKDTTGQRFTRLGYKQYALADPLKSLARRLNGEIESMVQAHGWEAAKDKDPGVREFLVKLGTAGRQTFAEGENFWIDQAFKRVRDGDYPVFTDVRFINEAKLLRDKYPGALLVRVNRPGYGPSSSFEDEVPLIDVDLEVDNDGDVEDLWFKIGEAFFDRIAEHTTEQMELFSRRYHDNVDGTSRDQSTRLGPKSRKHHDAA